MIKNKGRENLIWFVVDSLILKLDTEIETHFIIYVKNWLLVNILIEIFLFNNYL